MINLFLFCFFPHFCNSLKKLCFPLYLTALCKDDANGNVPLGKSCNRYWACQGGYPRLQRCPATLVFDKRSLRCTNPPTEDCEAPPPPPPEDDPNAPAGPALVEEEEPAAPASLV